MNQPIARLFLVVLVMFALLVAFTSRWTVFDASALRANPNNKRPGLEQQYVERGTIVAADQTTVLAQSIRQRGGVYVREYPLGPLFAPPLGYYDPTNGRTGLEAYYNGSLAGSPAQQSSIIDQLEGKHTNGDEVVTTLDARAQQVAYAGLAGRPGAVIALVPSTGAIKVFADSPSYDPNRVKTAAGFKALLAQTKTTPLLNRVTQAQYAPGRPARPA